jgi:hypothetical protein
MIKNKKTKELKSMNEMSEKDASRKIKLWKLARKICNIWLKLEEVKVLSSVYLLSRTPTRSRIYWAEKC